jgi:hypothetical protein
MKLGSNSEYKIIAFDIPYVNLIFHRECYDEIVKDAVEEYIKSFDNFDELILKYMEN